MPKVPQNRLVVYLALAIIIIVALIYQARQADLDNTAVLPVPASSTDKLANFDFIMPEAWPLTERAQTAIAELTPNQSLQFGIVSNPTTPELVYFGTSAPDPKNAGYTLASIYAYDTSNYTFERIYRRSFASGELAGINERGNAGLSYNFHIIGYDTDKLVVLAQDADDSPGRCTEVLTLGRDADDLAREMFSLNLLDPYAKGLEPYRVPDEAYNEALKRQNECIIE